MRSHITKIMSLVLVLSMMFSMVACSNSKPNATLSNSNGNTMVENIETESIIHENILTEFITEEIYLQEMVIAEDKIFELLIEEKTISEVLLCKTIYVPQDNIEEFSENSQIDKLFGDDVDLAPVLTKIAVGTGVIVTLVVLKVAGLPEPVASVVVAAADKSLKFAGTGAAIGSLYGGLTGAADQIDETGRTSSIIGFATATAGLVLSIISLVAEVPSSGSSTITLAAGIKLIVAGIGIAAGTAGTVYAGYNAVKTFTASDATDIDWERIDWEKAGASAAQKAIENAADGYMWGSIIGAVHGGAEGYDFYHKYNTPYTEYNARLMQTPIDGERGKWTGDRGESDFVLNKPIELQDGAKITKISYHNAVPDFSPYAIAEVKIPDMTNERYSISSKNIVGNFDKANEALAKSWTEIRYQGRTWKIEDVESFIDNYPYKLTWHEMSNMESMQLVPYDVNHTFNHYGGVAEYNAMIGQKGVGDFD